MSKFHFEQGRRYAAGVQAPGIPIVQFFNQVDILPGFSGAQVYPAGQAPIPSGTPLGGADFVIVATRSDPTADVDLPPGVLWIVDVYPDMPTVPSKQPGAALPGTTPHESAPTKIMGFDPMTVLLVGLAGVVVITLATSKLGT
jgi:hypothetical protein